MPIRSDRGRNAALRVLAAWPLHSPRRLVGTIAALTALAVGCMITATATTSRAPQTTAAPAVVVPTTTTVRSSTSMVAAAGDLTWLSRRFAETWIAKQDPRTWRERIAPLCTDEFRTVILPATTPESVSAKAVVGSAELIRATGRTAELKVPLDTMVLALTLQDITGKNDWRVADARPAR